MFFRRDDKERLLSIGNTVMWIAREVLDQRKRLMNAQEEINRLTSIVSRNTEVTSAATMLLQRLSAQIRDMADDPAEIRKLADELERNATNLGDAVAANTPAATGGETGGGEQPTEETREQEVDENGNPKFNEDGSPVFKARRRRVK